eukprot:CAMPEP_0174892144 /NCGR_PEP_ID=MMETSP0167-20121228/7161_1 /TAXON_ID=38298 /ORGANISM="Rhodella maculata, Strain CCMP736" /LENGTH=243 /DNA_ID=CAMNT_0016130563 /DNA_START=34 /DNA_END=763 /DNA_ORIENTATION=-
MYVWQTKKTQSTLLLHPSRTPLLLPAALKAAAVRAAGSSAPQILHHLAQPVRLHHALQLPRVPLELHQRGLQLALLPVQRADRALEVLHVVLPLLAAPLRRQPVRLRPPPLPLVRRQLPPRLGPRRGGAARGGGARRAEAPVVVLRVVAAIAAIAASAAPAVPAAIVELPRGPVTVARAAGLLRVRGVVQRGGGAVARGGGVERRERRGRGRRGDFRGRREAHVVGLGLRAAAAAGRGGRGPP